MSKPLLIPPRKVLALIPVFNRHQRSVHVMVLRIVEDVSGCKETFNRRETFFSYLFVVRA
jgi:hypothetical protein